VVSFFLGACHGLYQDSTPFQYSEETRAVDHFGKQLIAAGYNYWGNETMYCGMTGEEFQSTLLERFGFFVNSFCDSEKSKTLFRCFS
jgi:fructose-1,6-bisphosphatase